MNFMNLQDLQKKLIQIILVFLAVFSMSAETAVWKGENYDLRAFYRPENYPGDAVFIRLVFNAKEKNASLSSEAEVEFFADAAPEKIISKSEFFTVERKTEKRKVTETLVAGIPLSSYLSEGTFFAKVTFSAFGNKKEMFTLKISVGDKEFISETIELDSRNTAIKTDDSRERYRQIESLNKILFSVNKDSVFETANFVPPVSATRRTSFFADRRIYVYTDGNSSRNLHYGIDYGVPTGTEVFSCGRGKVVMAENRISTGWSICIGHLPGLYSLYYHLDKMNVKTGDFVESGTLIGVSGATGLATGPHLHWEVRLNGEAVSPDFFTTDFTFQQEQENLSHR